VAAIVRELRESLQKVQEEPESAQSTSPLCKEGAQERAQRPWWRRVFGG
jgi:hypothetical protein